ncbi:hypothetical protein B0H14DRAFT_2640225 [Mycena olivaceomarginata]|nr:hypothetical protein B0H14DRAFT_2640225 [Mycena olivaceomarginata]
MLLIYHLFYVSPQCQLLYVIFLFVGTPTHRFNYLTCFLPALFTLVRTILWTVTEHGQRAARVEEWEWEVGGDGGATWVRNLEREMDEEKRRYWPIKDAYFLRLEVVETFYIMWRTTRDVKWREQGCTYGHAWPSFEPVELHMHTRALETSAAWKPPLIIADLLAAGTNMPLQWFQRYFFKHRSNSTECNHWLCQDYATLIKVLSEVQVLYVLVLFINRNQVFELAIRLSSTTSGRGGAGETYTRLRKIPNTSDGQLQWWNNFHRFTSSRVSAFILDPFRFDHGGHLPIVAACS